MKDFDRKEWLKTLKKGDKVANKEHYGLERYKYYKIYEVKNITKTGKIRLDSGELLNENGEYCNYDIWSGTDIYIVPVTEEVLKVNEERRIRRKFYNLLFKAEKGDYVYTTEQKKKIIELLEAGEKNE